MRILTAAEFGNNRIPKPEDFKPALESFEEECVLPFLEREVLGAFSYGSVNRDDCNVASDIDYLMVVANGTGEQQARVRKATKRIYDEKSIVVQARVIEERLALFGMHSIEPSFRQHLELSVQLYDHHGVNPLELLADNEVSFEQSLRDSMSGYLAKLDNMYANHPTSEDQQVAFLKAIMEKPFHAMRIAIQHACGTVAPDGVEGYQDTKEALMESYRLLDPDQRLLDDIERINQM